MILHLLKDAVQGTRWEWIIVVLLLPLVGRAAARSWGHDGVLAAQRALLLVTLGFAHAVLLALPLHAGALLVASLPLVGGALSRTAGTFAGRPLLWAVALLLALPALSISHLGPTLWAPLWFIVFFALAILRGVLEPAWSRVAPWVAWLRRRILAHPADDDTASETTIK